MSVIQFDPGFDISLHFTPLGFGYGEGVFGCQPEYRYLKDIRSTLKNPECDGPEIVYAIAMDVGRQQDRALIASRNLLFGAVVYAKGQLGNEPIRSQGHIHSVSPSCQSSTCEVYEIWSGSAYIYMQETAQDNPGRCYAVYANPGEVVIVPPGWAHATISANIHEHLAFGAWCVRDFGFDYNDVWSHGGVAWFPVIDDSTGKISFVKNQKYCTERCVIKKARNYIEFGINPNQPLYQQFGENPDRFMFVSQPELATSRWQEFVP